MTKQEALAHVNNIRGFEVKEIDLSYSLCTCEAVNDLMAVSQLVENAGGQLQSRQVMATIVYLAEKRVAERD